VMYGIALGTIYPLRLARLPQRLRGGSTRLPASAAQATP